MLEEWVVGVDPGRGGALCLLSSNGDTLFHDMPQTAEQFIFLLETVRGMNPKLILIEDVHSLFGMSAKSNFQFGGWVKAINLVLEMAVHPQRIIEHIPPKSWQNHLGIKFPKNTPTKQKKALSAEHALSLNPKIIQHIYGPKGGLYDGRVDAYLIARVAIDRRIEHEKNSATTAESF